MTTLRTAIEELLQAIDAGAPIYTLVERLRAALGAEPDGDGMATEDDGFRSEAAGQFGFRDFNDDCTERLCTTAQLVAFAKSCERKGRAEAAQVVRRELNNPLNAQAKSPLLAVLGALKKRNDESDAELAPILAAEEARFMTSRGYVRARDDQPGARWIKPTDLLCVDEGCPHHGTSHVCVDRTES